MFFALWIQQYDALHNNENAPYVLSSRVGEEKKKKKRFKYGRRRKWEYFLSSFPSGLLHNFFPLPPYSLFFVFAVILTPGDFHLEMERNASANKGKKMEMTEPAYANSEPISAIEWHQGCHIIILYLFNSLGHGVLLESDVGGEASDLAGDPLHALLALDDGHVHAVHALHDVGHGGNICEGKKAK